MSACFRNADPDAITKAARALSLSAVQLHGDESPDYVQGLKAQLPTDCEVWKAHGISDTVPELAQWEADRHLLDSRVGQQSGGTGIAFDWQLIPVEQRQHIMLAGGLTPDNVIDAAHIGCKGLDLNSGVESAPGKKDATKIESSFRGYQKVLRINTL